MATVWCKVVRASVSASAPAAHFINVHVRSFCLTSQTFAFSLLGLILSLLALTLAPGVQVQPCCLLRAGVAAPGRSHMRRHACTHGAMRARAHARRAAAARSGSASVAAALLYIYIQILAM